jgi:hypothetical protein
MRENIHNVVNHGSPSNWLVDEDTPPGHYRTITGEFKPIQPPGVCQQQARGKGGKVSIIKEWKQEAVFPNGLPVEVEYKWLRPDCSRLWFRHEGFTIARVYARNGPKDVTSIARLIEGSMADGFQCAIYNEQKDYLARATPPQGEDRPDKATFTMTAEAARFYAGQYALCEERGGKLIPLGSAYQDIQACSGIWHKLHDQGYSMRHAFVCGCCRWKRQWVRLRFDPLVGTPGYDLTPEDNGEEGEEPCDTALTTDCEAALSSVEPSSMTTTETPPTSPPSRTPTSALSPASGSRTLKRTAVKV